MREFVKRPLAKEDLIGIWSYTFNKWGEAQADKYLSEIDAKIAQFQYNPHLGRSRDEVRAGYRSLLVNHHVVYYVVTPSLIRIVRVLHEHMDPNRHLQLWSALT